MEKALKGKEGSLASRRIAAALIDIAILLLCNLVFSIPCIIAFVNDLISHNDVTCIATMVSALFTGAFSLGMDLIYLVAMPLYKNGQTIGLRFFDLRISSFDSNSAQTKQYLIRFLTLLLLIASTIGFILISELVTICLSSKHKSLVDVLSSTMITDK